MIVKLVNKKCSNMQSTSTDISIINVRNFSHKQETAESGDFDLKSEIIAKILK